MSIPVIECLDCGARSYGWAIEAGDTTCATCLSENTQRVEGQSNDGEDQQGRIDEQSRRRRRTCGFLFKKRV